MNSSCSIKVSNDTEIYLILHIKNPQLTKNNQTNRNARYFMETIIVYVRISITIYDIITTVIKTN